MKTRFLMTQGDPDLPKLSPLYMAEFPKDVRNIFEYDLVIIGDVPSGFFKPGQLELLEEQIKEHGGSLIMLAGSQAAPSSYVDTPVARILPVNIGVGKAQAVANNRFPEVPRDQVRNSITTLDDSPETNQRIWSKVRPLGRLPVLDDRRHLQGVISIDDILRVPQRRGIPYPEVILEALRGIVARPTAADLHR